jgi:hypothetical protein
MLRPRRCCRYECRRRAGNGNFIPAKHAPKKRTMSAASRAAIAKAQKASWAAKKAKG